MFAKPFKLSRPLELNKTCSVCGQKMEPEVGFYYGAMFISYVFIAFISLGMVGALVFLFKVSVDTAFIILISFLAVIFIWNIRFARSLWAHLTIKFDKTYKSRLEM